MATVISVTNQKGGVGKTTTSAAISMGLAKRGHKTAVIDFDVGLRNLDLVMGCERRVVYDLINVWPKVFTFRSAGVLVAAGVARLAAQSCGHVLTRHRRLRRGRYQ